MFRMRNIDWWEYGGAGAQALLVDYVESGNLPFLQGVTDLDLYVDGAVVLADLAFSDHMHGEFGSALDGAAVYAAGDLVAKLVKKVLPATTTTSTSGTSAAYNFVQAAAPAPVAAFAETPDLSAFEY